ncbi:MAG: VWA domain-containing protein [Myxococcales bacterium]|nr:VWA domain-containing protein [Myxococcales bacterium]MBL9108658.1 VWA domain-containing protein [Myxococcales bacterium]
MYTLFAALGVLLVASLTVALVRATVLRHKDVARFGEPSLVRKLRSFDADSRRTVKGVLLVLGIVSALFALARPRFGRGVKHVPATNLDVVVVLDYSKSMYARDVVPSRTARAKAEVARLVRDLRGARFGAVAFAGEPMSFPMTSDGAAIAQFFQGLEPNDMPVGGTATARALERARDLLARDPKSKEHVRIVVLVTDGEDTEGDPTRVAEAMAQEGTRVDVIQIGSRAPEPIPEVGPDGRVVGIRQGDDGKPLLTQLTPEAETQLSKIAEITKGRLVTPGKGETGIEDEARDLRRLMSQELSERVETVFAEEYAWPLGLALVLLAIEALLPDAPAKVPLVPLPVRAVAHKPRGRKRARAAADDDRERRPA